MKKIGLVSLIALAISAAAFGQATAPTPTAKERKVLEARLEKILNALIPYRSVVNRRQYVAGVIVDVRQAQDGGIEYLLCTQQDGLCDRYSKFILVAHPERDMKFVEGKGIGTTPDGRSYYGYAYHQEVVPDAVFIGGTGVAATLYDTHDVYPPKAQALIEEKEAIKARLYSSDK